MSSNNSGCVKNTIERFGIKNKPNVIIETNKVPETAIIVFKLPSSISITLNLSMNTVVITIGNKFTPIPDKSWKLLVNVEKRTRESIVRVKMIDILGTASKYNLSKIYLSKKPKATISVKNIKPKINPDSKKNNVKRIGVKIPNVGIPIIFLKTESIKPPSGRSKIMRYKLCWLIGKP